MTAMPQRIAISHVFGALAATLVGVAEYCGARRATIGARARWRALGFEVLFGSLTITGSFMAFGKLQEFITGRADHLSAAERGEHRAVRARRS